MIISRVERDGGSHGGHNRSGRRQGARRTGRRQQGLEEELQQVVRGGARRSSEEGRRGRQEEEGRRGTQEEEGRRGRQSGGLGLALGVLNSPADQDGNYNFK